MILSTNGLFLYVRWRTLLLKCLFCSDEQPFEQCVRTSFLGAEACLLAGSAKNAYHTKYRGVFKVDHVSCSTLRKGVFAAGAALTLLSLLGSVLYYWIHSKADTGGWQKHQNEGLGMTPSDYGQHQQHQQQANEFQKV